MPKIHRSDLTPPQETPVAPHAALYDQDQDTAYEQHKSSTAKQKRKSGGIVYTIAMVIFAAIFLVSGGLLVKRYLGTARPRTSLPTCKP